MRFVHADDPARRLLLGYCLNLHPARDLDEGCRGRPAAAEGQFQVVDDLAQDLEAPRGWDRRMKPDAGRAAKAPSAGTARSTGNRSMFAKRT